MSIKAVAHALTVLRCFDAAHPEWGVAELSRRTGLEKSHVAKILREFTDARFLVQDPATRRYRVGPNAMSVGAGFLAGSELVRRSLEHMRRLSGETGYTITLNTLDGESVLFLTSVEGACGMRASWPVGGHIPFHATAAGKVHAAFLPDPALHMVLDDCGLPAITPATIRDPRMLRRQLGEIRRTGYACTYGESTMGLGGIAAPILGRSERFLGAISLLFPLRSPARTRVRELVAALHSTARRISRELGVSSYPYRALH